jgi:hypothetical protein
VLDLELSFSLQVEGDQRAVEVSSYDVVAVWGVRQRYDERVKSEQGLTFIRLQVTGLDFTASESNHEFSRTVCRPGHASDRRVLGELVADGLLVSPLGTELVDEDDVVRLSTGQFLRIGGEGDSAHNVGSVVLVCRSD